MTVAQQIDYITDRLYDAYIWNDPVETKKILADVLAVLGKPVVQEVEYQIKLADFEKLVKEWFEENHILQHFTAEAWLKDQEYPFSVLSTNCRVYRNKDFIDDEMITAIYETLGMIFEEPNTTDGYIEAKLIKEEKQLWI